MADTIFAFATGEMSAAIAVMRISGPAAQTVADKIAGGGLMARKAAFRRLRHPMSGELLDEAVALWFPGPASFSGEDCLELHIHGGAAVRRALSAALLLVEGCRAARPGEFTRRAFLNGKLDLAQAEGLGDLLAAETELQRRQAVANLEGGLSGEASKWRSRLLDAAGLVEALLDFADEGDAPRDVELEVRSILGDVIASMEQQLDGSRYSELVQRGARVVISGPPNAGKSSLLNALAKRDVAIVTEVAGTTRDLLEVRLDIDGLEIILVDTAGVREASDPVEKIGVARALSAAAAADLVLELYPADGGRLPSGLVGHRKGVLSIISKSDLVIENNSISKCVLPVSSKDDTTLRLLLKSIRDQLLSGIGTGQASLLTNTRQIDCVLRSKDCLREALGQDFAAQLEITGFHLREGLRALDELVGSVGADDILDIVFSKFCMGK